MSRCILLLAMAFSAGLSWPADGRTWTDSSGNYRVEADLIGFNDTTAVLKKESRQLVAVPIAKLSQGDQAFLRSKEAADQSRRAAGAGHRPRWGWTRHRSSHPRRSARRCGSDPCSDRR